MIDYEVVTLTMPVVYLGTMLGVKIGAFMNPLMLMGLLALVLFYTFTVTIKKAKELWLKENENKRLGEALLEKKEKKKRDKKSRTALTITKI